MSLTGKYSPLNLNSLGSFVQNQGLRINANAELHMGTSTALSTHVMGTTTLNTVLRMLVHSIRSGFLQTNLTCYDTLISIGSQSIPALGDSKPPQYLRSTTLAPYPSAVPYTGEYTSYGWLRTIPLQAHYEFYINNGSYSDFLHTFNMAHGFIGQSNKAIDAMNAADTYLDGTYSNMNDLITADLAGVSLALFFWGQDLIALGRALDLGTIDTYGRPSNLLKTLYKNKALTKAVNLALLAAGFSSDDMDYIIGGEEATVEQQKKLYGAFSIVMGVDLVDALIPMNCQTKGLGTLADLLNPKMLFPTSYTTLTVPEYNATAGPTNSKTYYLLYTGGEVTSQVLNNYGEQLKTILPATLAASCAAFSATMLQVKNIKSMDIERFSQVVRNLETVSDLGVNGTNVPTNQDIRTSALPLIALGSGTKGRYTTCDFFGAMSGLTYDWNVLSGYLTSLGTTTLYHIYRELYLAITWEQATVSVQYSTRLDAETNIYYYSVTGLTLTDPGGGYGRSNTDAPTISISNGGGAVTTIGVNESEGTLITFGKVTSVTLSSAGPESLTIPTAIVLPPPGPGWPGMNDVVLTYISQANGEIVAIATNNPATTIALNKLYNVFGNHLTLEQNARSLGLRAEKFLPDLSTVVTEIYGFMESLNGYAVQTEKWGPVQNLEAITDTDTVGGNSMIGSMREVRNAQRLGLTGAEQDNEVGIEQLILPRVNGAVPTTTSIDPITGNTIIVPIVTTGTIVNIPINTGGASTAESPGGAGSATGSTTSVNPNAGNSNTSPWTTLVPNSIDIISITPIVKPSILTPAQAIEDVILCNCDCWDNIV